MRASFLALASTVVLLGAAGSRAADAPRERDSRSVLVGKELVLAGPPEAVCSAVAEQAEWSPESRFALVLRSRIELPSGPVVSQPAIERSLVLWNEETHKTTEIWKARASEAGGRHQLGWTGTPGVALVLTHVSAGVPQPGLGPLPPSQACLLRVDARRGTARQVGNVPDDAQLVTCPIQPLGAVVSFSEHSVRFIRGDGTVRPGSVLPAGLLPIQAYWRTDGAMLVVTAVPLAAKPGVAAVPSQLSLDPASGKLEQGPISQRAYEPPVSRVPLHLESSVGDVSGGNIDHPIRPLWLVASETARTLVAADAEWGRLSPDGNSVMYSTDQAIWVRPLPRLPAEAAAAARAAASRARYMNNAKQIGLALLIYAQDHQDQLPAAGEVLPDLLKDATQGDFPESLFEGFVYTYPGGKISDIQATSDTILGYTLQPGGRIDLYADGHVTFEADKK